MAVVAWLRPVAVEAIRPSVDLTLARSLPAGTIGDDALVTVDLRATFASGAPEDGCYEVIEAVPSGLAPIDGPFGLGGSQEVDRQIIYWPSSIVGQQVGFCVPNDAGRPVRMRYQARVVNVGTYAWEPAILQLPAAPELVAVTPADVRTVVSK
jgi:hypothetical protein